MVLSVARSRLFLVGSLSLLVLRVSSEYDRRPVLSRQLLLLNATRMRFPSRHRAGVLVWLLVVNRHLYKVVYQHRTV